jgi:hypothetical protein
MFSTFPQLPLNLIEMFFTYDGNECSGVCNPMFRFDGSTDLPKFLSGFPVGIPSGIGVIGQDTMDMGAVPQSPRWTFHFTAVKFTGYFFYRLP